MREDGHVLRWALDFEVDGKRKTGRLNRRWKKKVVDEIVKIGLRRDDALFRLMWCVGVNQIAAWLRFYLATLTCLGYYQILSVGVSLSLSNSKNGNWL